MARRMAPKAHLRPSLSSEGVQSLPDAVLLFSTRRTNKQFGAYEPHVGLAPLTNKQRRNNGHPANPQGSEECCMRLGPSLERYAVGPFCAHRASAQVLGAPSHPTTQKSVMVRCVFCKTNNKHNSIEQHLCCGTLRLLQRHLRPLRASPPEGLRLDW